MKAAVLGKPIAHSLSPALHIAAYQALGLDDWTYQAIECDEAGLAAFVGSRGTDWAGLSLTMPLKRTVLPLLDHVDPLAAATGGANTVVFRPDGRYGYNTDVRGIVDALDDAAPKQGAALIAEANRLVQERVVVHERDDEGSIYPRLANLLRESHSLSAMSRAHREILHLARLLGRIAQDLPTEKVDRYLIRDAQRVIEAIETLVRMHTAQEDDIYEAVAARTAA